MLYLEPLLVEAVTVSPATFAAVSAAAALRRSAQTIAQSISSIDVGEFTDGVERIAGDRQRFVGAAEQLGSDLLCRRSGARISCDG